VYRTIKNLTLLAVFALFCASTQAGVFLSIDSLSGKIEVQRADRQIWQPATAGMKLGDNDRIHTSTQGYASLSWPDGSIAYLHRNSQMRVNVCIDEKPHGKALNYATIYNGSSFFLVKKITPHGLFDDCALRVFTPTASISVRGTAFQVSVDEKTGTTGIKVLSGAIQVNSGFQSKLIFLGSPYQTMVTKGQDCTPPEAVTNADIDSLKTWMPANVVTAIMEKQSAKSKSDYRARDRLTRSPAVHYPLQTDPADP
jgi:hypothetical protein